MYGQGSINNQGNLLPFNKSDFFFTKGPSKNNVGNWEGGVKNWSKLPMDSTKKLPTWGSGFLKKKPVKTAEKLLTSFIDSPLHQIMVSRVGIN